MLIRKRVTTTEPERDVVVVRPRQPTGLYAALGLGTLAALGLVAYLSWALPQGNRDGDYETTAVIVDDRNAGRAQTMTPPKTPAPNPPTVIINQPPIVHTPPPVVVKPPDRTVIVEGYSGEPTPRPTPRDPATRTNDRATDQKSGDVDGTLRGEG